MKVLIVDDDLDLAELIELQIQEYSEKGTVTLLATSGLKAIKALQEDPSIDLCICDHNMPNGMGYDVQKYIVKENLGTRFVLCSSYNSNLLPGLYDVEKLFMSIRKPDVSQGILNLIKKLGSESKAYVEQIFLPVSIRILNLMGQAPTDLYIRVSDKKFVKCINKNERFTDEDHNKYRDKNVDFLFVQRMENIEEVNKAITLATMNLLELKNLPLTDKLTAAHAQLSQQMKRIGITPEIAEASKKMVSKSVELMSSSVTVTEFWKKLNLLGDYPSRLYTLHSMLACGALIKSKYNSEENLFKLTFCAFIQDVALDSIAIMEICDHQEFLSRQKDLSEADIKKYYEHPMKATEILNQFGNLPFDIFQIIIEQNEMPDGNGFPRKIPANKLAPLSCFFIVTGIFARHLLRDEENFDFRNFIISMKSKGYYDGNFKASLDALKAMQSSVIF